MNVRTLTLGSAAIAAALFCALPASAQPRYTQNSTPEERAQTEALNRDASDRARGDSADDADARDAYNAHRAEYDRGVRDNALERAAYDRDMSRYNDRYGHGRYGYGRYGYGRSTNTISINFGDIAFGYSDGYWDNGHRWHAWRNDADARAYRNHHGSNYHGWHHDRDRNNGWMRN